ncbi:hypothetical protein [Leptospira neocaledonica]|uniref:Uncharacterized protein n=1 Tax=Leptospira neocaledonica TaxID=2023192 RepID=A0A2M9ZZH6_9LEPT|nr:hypothetical protein [Leptospira neocaledonica]PJZ77435.1 hypothetical protein CH365_07570 [Leptospira neocaledonica]
MKSILVIVNVIILLNLSCTSVNLKSEKEIVDRWKNLNDNYKQNYRNEHCSVFGTADFRGFDSDERSVYSIDLEGKLLAIPVKIARNSSSIESEEEYLIFRELFYALCGKNNTPTALGDIPYMKMLIKNLQRNFVEKSNLIKGSDTYFLEEELLKNTDYLLSVFNPYENPNISNKYDGAWQKSISEIQFLRKKDYYNNLAKTKYIVSWASPSEFKKEYNRKGQTIELNDYLQFEIQQSRTSNGGNFSIVPFYRDIKWPDEIIKFKPNSLDQAEEILNGVGVFLIIREVKGFFYLERPIDCVYYNRRYVRNKEELTPANIKDCREALDNLKGGNYKAKLLKLEVKKIQYYPKSIFQLAESPNQ